MKHPMPQIGDRFGNLTIIGDQVRRPTKRGSATYYLVRCDCGSEYYIQTHKLKQTTQCVTCYHELQSNTPWRVEIPSRHQNRLYMKIHNSITRCTDPTHRSYHNYGGRGIRVHQPWFDNPLEFAKYLMTLQGWDDCKLVLDRIDNDGNYEPGNLQFVTAEDSANNRRNYICRKPYE